MERKQVGEQESHTSRSFERSNLRGRTETGKSDSLQAYKGKKFQKRNIDKYPWDLNIGSSGSNSQIQKIKEKWSVN
jgi:hypothetical protein